MDNSPAFSRKKSWARFKLFIPQSVNKKIRTTLTGLLALYITIPCMAKTEVDTTSTHTHTIEEIEVSARRISKSITSATSTQQMDRQTISALAVQNAAEAIRHFAGTTVKDYGGIGGLKTVSVRGLGATHTAVSYDDVVLGNCQAGQTDLGRFSSGQLSAISLHIGQDDNLLGTARALASGSLVKMSSLHQLPQEKKRHIEAAVRVGSFGYLNSSIHYVRSISKRTLLSLTSDLSTAHGRYPYLQDYGNTQNKEERTNTDVYQFAQECGIRHHIDSTSYIDGKIYYYNAERGLPGAVILYNNNSKERLIDKNFFAQAKYTKQWNHKWQLRSIAKYTYGYNHYTDTNVKYSNGKYSEMFDQEEYYTQATLLYRPKTEWQLSIAQDGYINTLQSDLPHFAYPLRYTSLTALQAQYKNARLTLHGILLNTAIHESVQKGKKLNDICRLSPTFSISVHPFTIPLYLRMMYKNTFRVPTFNELYYQASGNKGLRPERAHEYTMGITWQWQPDGILKNFTLTADGYFNNVTDKIVAFPTTYVWKMANYGRVHITGLDATIGVQLEPYQHIGIDFGVNYTLQQAIDITDPTAPNYRLQLPYTPRHSGSGRILLSTPWLNVGYSTIAASSRHSSSDKSLRYHLKGYMEHSLTLSRIFNIKQTELVLQADAINFTNAQYEIIQYYPMPGRQFRVSLTFKL